MSRSTAAAGVLVAVVLLFAATASAATPTISYSIDGISGSNGWYRGSTHGDNVLVHWSVSPDTTSTNCLAVVTIAGPTAGTKEACWAANAEGRTSAVTRVIKIDATPPTGVTAQFARRPDHNGWYNHPVRIRWRGSDALSGIAYCTAGTYRGPDSSAATANGGCFDRAGNSSGRQVRLAYDSTPPVVRRVTEQTTGTGNVLSWSSSSASDRVVVRRRVRGLGPRALVYVGTAGGFTDPKIRAGVEYVYSVRSFDEAGNRSRVVSVDGPPKVLTLRSRMRYVPHAAPNPILRWQSVRGAGYYNVQLYRGSKRIFVAWPRFHQVGLQMSWRWSGRRRYLLPGRYRWYVWAGFGPRKLAHYRSLGSASFVVPR